MPRARKTWPACGSRARAGDQRIASDLAAALGPRVAACTSDLYFDGGDFMAATFARADALKAAAAAVWPCLGYEVRPPPATPAIATSARYTAS